VPTLSDKGLTGAKRRHVLKGGMVILVFGQAVYKENMAGLWHRWTESLEHVDEKEQLLEELEHNAVVPPFMSSLLSAAMHPGSLSSPHTFLQAGLHCPAMPPMRNWS